VIQRLSSICVVAIASLTLIFSVVPSLTMGDHMCRGIDDDVAYGGAGDDSFSGCEHAFE
jgi:hypothetical protein